MIQVIIRGSDQTGEATASAAQNVQRVGDAAETQGNRLRGFFAGLKTVIAGAAVGAGLAIGAIAASGLSMNNAMEQASARIQAFTKDAGATADVLEMVRDRAAKTPFAFNEMSSAAANLLPTSKAAGKSLEELLSIAEVLAASNPAEGLEGAAFALKEATSGDFTSIIERFNLPRQRLKELREQGVPDLEAVQIAMKELGLDTDLVTGLANTAQGRWSTFMDTLQTLASTLTQPIFDAFSAGLGQVQSGIDANMPAIQAFAEGLATRIGGAMTWLTGTGIPMLLAGWAAIQPGIATAQTGFAALSSALLAVRGPVADLLDSFIYLFSPEYDPGAYGDSWSAVINEVLVPAFNQAIAIVGPVVEALQQQLPGALTAGQAAFTQLSATVQDRMAAIQAVVMAILPIILGFWQQNGASIMASVQLAFNTIVQIITTASTIVNQLLLILAGFMDRHGATIVAVLTAAWTVISGVVTGALQLISGLLSAALQLIQGDFSGAWETIKTTAMEFARNLVGVIEGLANLLGAAIDLGIAAITDAWKAFLAAAPGFGGDLIAGIVQGVSNGVGALKEAITGAAKSALDAAKKALGISSPSRLFSVQVGYPIAQGMAEGIQRGAPLVAESGSRLALAAAMGATQGSGGGGRLEGNIGVQLSMKGELSRFIAAEVDQRVNSTALNAFGRKRGGG